MSLSSQLFVAAMVVACATPAISSAEAPSLFDGKTLAGWRVAADSEPETPHWSVEGGVIRGENRDKIGSVLWTERHYTNYELTLEYRSPSDYYDSGVFVRGDSHQVQIGISGSLQRDMTACIYAPADGRGGYPAKSDRIGSVHRVGEWNQLRVIVVGNRVQTFLNDEPMVDYEAVTMPAEGPIGLQLHANHHMKIFFRELHIKETNPP